ncbi:MAG: DUF924 family protein [Candidatus Thiodiazotropha sp. 6PLUC5]
MVVETPEEIIDFWFSDDVKPRHFSSTPDFDLLLEERYLGHWEKAKAHQLDEWLANAQGCLALVLILDQFPLNIFRGQPVSFSTEQKSREVAKHAIDSGFDSSLTLHQRAFLYLPFMHSESLKDQDYSIAMFEKAGMQDNLKWARHHREIVRRFGRFPHRNKILNRENSSDEIAYLNSEEAFRG